MISSPLPQTSRGQYGSNKIKRFPMFLSNKFMKKRSLMPKIEENQYNEEPYLQSQKSFLLSEIIQLQSDLVSLTDKLRSCEKVSKQRIEKVINEIKDNDEYKEEVTLLLDVNQMKERIRSLQFEYEDLDRQLKEASTLYDKNSFEKIETETNVQKQVLKSYKDQITSVLEKKRELENVVVRNDVVFRKAKVRSMKRKHRLLIEKAKLLFEQGEIMQIERNDLEADLRKMRNKYNEESKLEIKLELLKRTHASKLLEIARIKGGDNVKDVSVDSPHDRELCDTPKSLNREVSPRNDRPKNHARGSEEISQKINKIDEEYNKIIEKGSKICELEKKYQYYYKILGDERKRRKLCLIELQNLMDNNESEKRDFDEAWYIFSIQKLYDSITSLKDSIHEIIMERNHIIGVNYEDDLGSDELEIKVNSCRKEKDNMSPRIQSPYISNIVRSSRRNRAKNIKKHGT